MTLKSFVVLHSLSFNVKYECFFDESKFYDLIIQQITLALEHSIYENSLE